MTDRVGVRELRQNLSRYLDRVKAGESLVVTERGEEVALLLPSKAVEDGYAELAQRLGATIPTVRLEDVIARQSGKRPSAPDGTTDAYLAEDRRDRF